MGQIIVPDYDKRTAAETPQNDPQFNINGGQTVSGGIGQQGQHIHQSGGTVNNNAGNDRNPRFNHRDHKPPVFVGRK
ncbi:hypothetical protein OS493_027148 [Desmophyllum pertusum]|uniref:Uncharacterized protein n=1 Tax=Desmophyllum pertusum TaxID=174260 RepID=A0A9W9ZY95_9CNID|nr:hypothetical protein OS493_027148 [Desmophyllum pertusum]